MDVVFYEKPGCINNTKQKRLLREAGHDVEDRNLLTWPWTVDALRTFFGDLPVAEWFNRSAPQVKSGAINPNALDAETALSLMVAEPLLIRRPLIETELGRTSGFRPGPDLDRLGLGLKPEGDLETCPRSHQALPEPCGVSPP